MWVEVAIRAEYEGRTVWVEAPKLASESEVHERVRESLGIEQEEETELTPAEGHVRRCWSSHEEVRLGWRTAQQDNENVQITMEWEGQKESQSIQQLTVGQNRDVPDNPGMPPIVLYGANAVLTLRDREQIPGRFEGTMKDFYGPEMAIEKIPRTQWALNAVMT
jgi:hypothetical protein